LEFGSLTVQRTNVIQAIEIENEERVVGEHGLIESAN
jgi:hypothetical protein